METAPLESFATWARTALIREVTGRIAAVLAPGSSERVEQAGAVAALEKAVADAGGGDKGRASVADKVAYTWFNRIIALRFMDANGYTGIGVVSPQAGVEVGQPEILAEAKRGVIDTDGVSQKTRTAVTGLLDGTRPSSDPQGEAYALLLVEYCRLWNRAMPFMFEREGDYTELLIPANLLADDSVLNRSVKVLTEDVCRDVEVIGWLYQFYISERKDEVFAGFKKNKKAGADEIPAATQLFTPHWIVRYLVENSLGRLWMLNRPSSGLTDLMEFYVAPVDEATDFLKIAKPEELKVIDPACGSGHMLTYAFDLLYAIYEEEGYSPAEIPGLILANNLFGTEIDPRAGALASFALTMKARGKQRTVFNKQFGPNVCVIEPISFGPIELDLLAGSAGNPVQDEEFWNQFREADTFGALIQPNPDETERLRRHLATFDGGGDMLKADVLDRAYRVVRQAEFLTPRYSVVVANPPYMGSGNMNSLLLTLAKRKYPDSKRDLYAMFVDRCIALAREQGCIAMITMHSWMFLASYEGLRTKLLEQNRIVAMAHLGTSGFDSIGGDVVSTTAFVVTVGDRSQSAGCFDRLLDGRSEKEKSELLLGGTRRFWATTHDLVEVPGAPIAYWLPPQLRVVFSQGRALADVADARAGMGTGDNDTFVRFWWEVSEGRCRFDAASLTNVHGSSDKWVAYNKGGSYRKWYGNQQHVLAFDKENYAILATQGNKLPSRQFYFLPGITWSKVSSGEPAFRYQPRGFVFDVAGNTAFSLGKVDERTVLAILNSSVTRAVLAALAPTLNFEAGQVAKIPILPIPEEAELDGLVDRLVGLSKRDWDDFETSWGFTRSSLVDVAGGGLADRFGRWSSMWQALVSEAKETEDRINRIVAAAYGVTGEVDIETDPSRISLSRNPKYALGPEARVGQHSAMVRENAIQELASYAVGCMFGRYSLDEQGLILANQRATLQDYLAKVPTPTFAPDSDNVIPIVEGDWFEDDIVERFRQFLRVAFGEQHFEENLRFVTESLGVKDLRDYFVKSFYKDHVQRYKKRPIYWLFSSPKGSFNALIYMHRYTSSTVSMVLNEYLREFQAKLSASLEHAERSNNAKEADRLRKVLLELNEYEHDVLYPLASQNIAIDLDDGVKVNYPKFGDALKKIPGLEANE